MSIINITVCDHIAKLNCTKPRISSGSVNVDEAQFEFDASWNGYSRCAVFYNSNKEEKYRILLDSTNKCVIPWEVLQEQTCLRIGVYGTKDDDIKTTSIVNCQIIEGISTDGLDGDQATPDFTAQILNALESKADKNDSELTGTPTAPTATAGTSTNQIATTAFVMGAISDMPSELDFIIKLEDFGCVGDGETDDTEAFQTALNMAASSSKGVLCNGTYLITDTLSIADETVIFSTNGKGAINSDADVLFKSAVSSQTAIKNFKINNMTFDCSADEGMFTNDTLSTCKISNCSFEHFHKIFNGINSCSSIDSSRFYLIKNNFATSVTDSFISHNYINASKLSCQTSIMINGTFNNSSFSGNFVDFFNTCFYLKSGSKPSQITGNTFDDCISVFHDGVVKLAITGNTFTNIKYDASKWSAINSNSELTEYLSAAKWCIFKFDGTMISGSQTCNLIDVSFTGNTAFNNNCEYYIYVQGSSTESKVGVYSYNCNFNGNAIEARDYRYDNLSNPSSDSNAPIADAGFISTGNKRPPSLYFDFWDNKSYASESALPRALLTASGSKQLVAFEGMKAFVGDDLYVDHNGRWYKLSLQTLS